MSNMIRCMIGLGIGMILAGFQVQAQRGARYPEGYVLSSRGDTTWGFVKAGDRFKDQRNIVFFDRFGVKVRYTADRIKGYGYEQNQYISHKLPYLFSGVFSDTVIFLHIIERGPVSLYRFYTRRPMFTFKGKAVYTEFLEMPDGTEHEISTQFRWKKIAEVFADYVPLAAEIRSGAHEPEAIPELVRRYNAWLLEERPQRVD